MRHAPSFALLLTLAATTAEADQVTDQIDAGLRAYQAGDARVAIQALQFAVAEIETQLSVQQMELLPQPLPGWSAEDAVAETGGFAAMIAGTNLSRSYRNDESGAGIQINITADSPLLSMMGMMMSAPMLMQAQPGSSPYTRAGFRGMLEKEDDGNVKITLMVGTRILIQMQGSGGASREALEAYLDAMDLGNLEKALLG